jgi:hypothetical protein
MQCSMCNHCSGLFTCIMDYLHVLYMYDSHGVDLCTMCDSHSVYLRLLWTICMYKFSRYHNIALHSFFLSNDRFSEKISRFLPTFIRESPN